MSERRIEGIKAAQIGRHSNYGPQPGQETVAVAAFLIARADIDALLERIAELEVELPTLRETVAKLQEWSCAEDAVTDGGWRQAKDFVRRSCRDALDAEADKVDRGCRNCLQWARLFDDARTRRSQAEAEIARHRENWINHPNDSLEQPGPLKTAPGNSVGDCGGGWICHPHNPGPHQETVTTTDAEGATYVEMTKVLVIPAPYPGSGDTHPNPIDEG
jgi:hypothetical protein